MAQQASVQADVERPPPPVTAPGVTKGVAMAAVSVVARPAPAVVATNSGTSNSDSATLEAERKRALAALVMFRKFDPQYLTGRRSSRGLSSRGLT